MPENNESFEQIQQHRDEIDRIDREIIKLLNERAGHSIAIRFLKPGANMQLFDPVREEQIYQKLIAINEGPMQEDNLREIYATLLKVMKEIPA